MIHRPVLLQELLDCLNLQKGEVVVDATIDGGGHALAVCKKIGSEGRLIGIDSDKDLVKKAKQKLKKEKPEIKIIQGNFQEIEEILKKVNFPPPNAIYFDLGMSSYHLEKSGRGFSFQRNEPLLMNYQPLSSNSLTAEKILNTWPEKKIYRILKDYGEERYAARIARNIVVAREKNPLRYTFDLVEIVRKSVPFSYQRKRIHYATRTFQALRIAVNDELVALEKGLIKSWKVLAEKGRIAVISFHSLEDRIVKNFFKEKKNCQEGEILTKKPIRPSEREIEFNPRARSAKLRAALKI